MNWTPRVAIIADDLTGACDAATPFAAQGLTTLVTWRLSTRLAADVLAVSTNSRHLTEGDAARWNRETLGVLGEIWGGTGPEWIYKKVDSTLRGHPGAELAAIMAVLGSTKALVAPAFPAQGRTTVGGQQRVDGCLVEKSALGHEARTSDVEALFGRWSEGTSTRLISLELVRRGAGAIGQALNAPGPALYLADAETEADLAALAQGAVASSVRLLCGSAGLCRALSQALNLVPGAERPELPPPPRGPVLVLAGSRHPSTLRQVGAARQRGAAVVQTPDAIVAETREPAPSESVERAAAYLAEGQSVILTTAGLGESPLGGVALAERLGRMASDLQARQRLGGLVLTGGDIALAACEALGSTALWLEGEMEPGIAVGRLLGGRWSGLPVVTKAGGFGTDQALALAIDGLQAGG